MLKSLAVTLGFILFLTSCQMVGNSQGKQLYKFYCSNCHMDDGAGLGKLYPPLAQADYLIENHNELACIIRHGIEGQISVNGIKYNQAMEGIAELNEVEIANISNYIFQNFYEDQHFFISPEQVKEQLEGCSSIND